MCGHTPLTQNPRIPERHGLTVGCDTNSGRADAVGDDSLLPAAVAVVVALVGRPLVDALGVVLAAGLAGGILDERGRRDELS